MALTTFTASQVLTAAQMNAVQGNDYNQTVSTKTASYTLIAADKGTRIVMNVTGASTVTVNTSLFSAGDTLTIQNISATACTVTAGTATVSSAGPLAIPQNGSGLLYFTSAGVSIFYPSAVTATAAASGLVCVKAETAFTTSVSVTTDGVFTSTYSNYLIWFNYTNTNTTDILMRLRASAVAASTNYNRQLVTFNQTTASPSQGNAAISLVIQPSNGNFKSSATINLANPQLAQATNITYSVTVNAGNYTTGQSLHLWATNQTDATQFDGIEWAVSTGSMTGTYAVYGYSKTV